MLYNVYLDTLFVYLRVIIRRNRHSIVSIIWWAFLKSPLILGCGAIVLCIFYYCVTSPPYWVPADAVNINVAMILHQWIQLLRNDSARDRFSTFSSRRNNNRILYYITYIILFILHWWIDGLYFAYTRRGVTYIFIL